MEAIVAAVLFGAATPVSKLLLGTIQPLQLAGLLYLGAGFAGALYLVVSTKRSDSRGYRLSPNQVLALLGALVAGGLLAPILLLYGLRATPAGTTSLLLNFESVATALIAGVVFHEAVGRRTWLAIGLITAAGCLLALRTAASWGLSWGVLGIVGACVGWGLDNNWTRLISDWDPMAIVCIKGLGAGSLTSALALVLGQRFPEWREAAMAVGLGAVSYGWSIALFVRALRELGAARTGALFGTAPFLGALVSWAILKETPSAATAVAAPLMLAGAWLLLTESHGHFHHHPALEHDHTHTHDDGHHDHVHAGGDVPPGTRHSHPHRHEAMTHEHPHAPDLHHRHGHRRG